MCDSFPDLKDDSAALVSEDHGGPDDEVSNGSMSPVVNVRSTNTHTLHSDEDFVSSRRLYISVFLLYYRTSQSIFTQRMRSEYGNIEDFHAVQK